MVKKGTNEIMQCGRITPPPGSEFGGDPVTQPTQAQPKTPELQPVVPPVFVKQPVTVPAPTDPGTDPRIQAWPERKTEPKTETEPTTVVERAAPEAGSGRR